MPNSENTKSNLFATIGPENTSGIVLSGHTDVVPTEGQEWKYPAFKMTKEGNRLYGRGTADMKSFISCALHAAMRASNMKLKTPLHLAFSYDEEIGKNNNEEEVKNEDIKTYIASLNLDTENWWFEIPEFKYDIIKRRLNTITRDAQSINPEEVTE